MGLSLRPVCNDTNFQMKKGGTTKPVKLVSQRNLYDQLSSPPGAREQLQTGVAGGQHSPARMLRLLVR